MKKIFSLAMAGIMALTMSVCTACGVDQSKVKGDWMIDTIAGKPAAEYVAGIGSSEIAVQRNYHIEEDKATVTEAGPEGTGTSKDLDVQWRSNGVELKDGDTVLFALELDEDKNVLKYKSDFSMIGGGKEEEVLLKKGTFDFAAALDEFNAAQQGAADEAALAEGEEIPAEGEEELAEGAE